MCVHPKNICKDIHYKWLPHLADGWDGWMHACMDAWMDGWVDGKRPFAFHVKHFLAVCFTIIDFIIRKSITGEGTANSP